MTTRRAQRTDPPGTRPARYRPRVDAEQRGHLTGGEQAVVGGGHRPIVPAAVTFASTSP
jgi:hypothetical protein